MHLSITLLFSCAASIKVVTSTPAGYQSPYSRYNGLLCEQKLETCNEGVQSEQKLETCNEGVQSEQKLETCNQGVQSEQLPSIVESPDTSVPILKQVFTTITRKKNHLNAAKANSNKVTNVKYQAGPSLEAEGESIEDSEGLYSSKDEEASPDTIVPEQNIQDLSPEQNIEDLSSDENFLGDQSGIMDDQIEEEQLPNWNSGEEQLPNWNSGEEQLPNWNSGDEEQAEQQPDSEHQPQVRIRML